MRCGWTLSLSLSLPPCSLHLNSNKKLTSPAAPKEGNTPMRLARAPLRAKSIEASASNLRLLFLLRSNQGFSFQPAVTISVAQRIATPLLFS